MNTADTIRTIIELLLVVLAIALMIFEPHIAAWEQRAARKALIWALEHIPEFREWLYLRLHLFRCTMNGGRSLNRPGF